jgi:Domain of unknown function (DUF4913)
VTEIDRPTENREPTAELATLRAQLRELRDEVDVLAGLVADTMHPTAAEERASEQRAAAQAPELELRHPTLADWVSEFFAPTFCRSISPSVRWCARWWDHAEAISRLEALWRCWEVLRLQRWEGAAVWYRDFLDPQLAVLLDPAGPFAQCTPDRHSPIKALPTVPAPAGWWGYPDDPDGEPLPENSPYR